jgi:hypothetical protein
MMEFILMFPDDAGAVAKQLRRSLDQGFLSGMNLGRMEPESTGQLGDGPLTLDGGQRYLGLEGRTMLLFGLFHVPATRIELI